MRIDQAAALVSDLKDAFEEMIGRLKQAMQDATGDIVLAIVKHADGGDVADVHDDKRDAWIHSLAALDEQRHHARQYIPAGIVFRKPKEGETAHVLRAKGHGGPGSALIIPDGGDGSKDFMPEWYGEKVGLYAQEPLRIEAKGKPIEITAGDAVIKVDENGKITIDSKSGQDIVLNGGTLSSARKTDPVYCGKMSAQAGPFPVVFAMVPPVAAAGNVTPANGNVIAGNNVDIGGYITDGAANVKE